VSAFIQAVKDLNVPHRCHKQFVADHRQQYGQNDCHKTEQDVENQHYKVVSRNTTLQG
jgi:hypothetical protein